MERNELVQLITKQVVQKLNASAAGSAASCGTCGTTGGCACPPAWDGIGIVGDMLQAGASRVSSLPPIGTCPDPGLARLIDHTLLKPDATEQQIINLCEEAANNCFMSVCVNPCWVPTARRILRGTGVKVCTVIGFPLGATFPRVKEFETRIAIDMGADEVDIVLNVGAMKSGDLALVERDIRAVVRATRGTVISKVILEVGFLTNDEIKTASELAAKAGANFVKTSTGFGKGGATVAAIRLMRDTVGKDMGVKASGGVRDHETALNLIGAGASRLGASASVAIVECAAPAGKGY